jgi:hypothetical protein
MSEDRVLGENHGLVLRRLRTASGRDRVELDDGSGWIALSVEHLCWLIETGGPAALERLEEGES